MDYFRTDKANIKVIETGEGFLKAKITIARPGVFKYINGDGSVSNEAKLPEDILSYDTVNSAKGVPITDDHPKLDGQHVLLDSLNYQQFIKGNISEPRIEDGKIVALATIYDSELIRKIKNKEQNQASIGFGFKVSNQPGIYEGAVFDVAQKNIVINHAAMVPDGRAGDTVKIHIDKKDKSMSNKWTIDGKGTASFLTFRRFDGTDVSVDPEIHAELMSAKNDAKDKAVKFDCIEGENKVLLETIEKMKAEKDDSGNEDLASQLEIANDKADEWKNKHDKLEISIPDMVDIATADRVELMDFAKSVDAEMKVDGLSNKEIKLQIIAKGLPFKSGVKFDSVTIETIEARYDAACELLRERAVVTDKSVPKLGIDANTVAAKRLAMSKAYDRKQEEINGGVK